MAPVKTQPATRRERAQATRRRIIEAAYRLFSDRGFTETTMGEIAADAGVAVQTVHFVFGTKLALLQAAMAFAATESEDQRPHLEQSWAEGLADETDPRRIIERVVGFARTAFPRIAKLALAVEAASVSDAEAAERWKASQRRRTELHRGVARILADLGRLSPEVTMYQAGDVMSAMVSAALYREFTTGRGWSDDEWADWLTQTLIDTLVR